MQRGRTSFAYIIKMLRNTEVKETIFNRKLFTFNEGVAYYRIINCTNTVDLKNIRTHLHKIRCK